LPGLFAGVSVEGTTLRPGDEENEQFNGHAIKAKEIVRGEPIAAPATCCHNVDVRERAHRETNRKQQLPSRSRVHPHGRIFVSRQAANHQADNFSLVQDNGQE